MNNKNQLHYWLLFITFVLLLGTGLYLDQANSRLLETRLRNDVLDQASILRARLEGYVNSNAQLVNGLVASMSSNPNINQEHFSVLARHLIGEHSQLRNIAAAPDLVIKYMYPVEGNEAAIGLDYRTIPEQLKSVIQARDTKRLVIAGPVDLVQGGQGLIARIPVFIDNQQTFWGMISAVIDMDRLYRKSGFFSENLNIEIALRGKDGTGAQGDVFYGRKELFSLSPVIVDVTLPFGSWQMAAIPQGAWSIDSSQSVGFRIILFIAVLFIMLPVYFLVRFYSKNRETTSRLQGLFELSPIGIALNDFTTGAFIEVNNALLEPTGYTHNEFLQLNYWDITPEEYRQQEAIQLNNLEKKGLYGPYEKEYIRKDGSRYPVLLNGMVVRDSNGKKNIWSIIEDISERRKSENALAETNKQLELVISSTAVGFWDWKVQTGEVEFNERWAEIIGYTLDELQPITIDTWLAHAHPDDMKESVKLLEAHWRGETERYICEARMQHKNGHWIWVLDTGTTVEWDNDGKPTRMIGTHLDITERKNAEQKLQASRHRYQGLVDDIGDTLVIYSHEAESGKMLFVTGGIETVFGITQEDAIGQKWTELVNWLPQSLELAQTYVTQLIEGVIHYVQFDMHFTHPHGDNRVIHVSCHPVSDENGKVITIDGIVEDITQQKQIEQELIVALEYAEKANQAKSEFLSRMSHELRTPMNAILGFSQLLELENLTEKQLGNISEIRKAGEHLLQLINEVLDLAKVESGHIDFTPETVSAREIIDDCLTLIKPIAQKNDIHVSFDNIDDLNIYTDRIRLKQTLLNLLSNAVKYNRKGGSVAIKSFLAENDTAMIQVRDTGPGIAAERLTEIFEPFNRLDAGMTEIEGTGIGLTLTRKIIKLMGGDIGVESETGVGSTFWITLPQATPNKPYDRATQTDLEDTPTASTSSDQKQSVILYIEDNPVNLKLVSLILGNLPHIHLLSAHTPQLGIDLATTRRPDLILLDINLPGMDGYQVLNILKHDNDTKDIPVIAITADAMPSQISKGKQSGFSAYITKPFIIEQFLLTLEQHLDQQHLVRQQNS